MPVERYAEILSTLKPRFIHHPRSKEFLRAILAERDCDLDRRTSTYPGCARRRAAAT